MSKPSKQRLPPQAFEQVLWLSAATSAAASLPRVFSAWPDVSALREHAQTAATIRKGSVRTERIIAGA